MIIDSKYLPSYNFSKRRCIILNLFIILNLIIADCNELSVKSNQHISGNLYLTSPEESYPLIKPYVIEASFSKEFSISVNNSIEYIFEFTYNTSFVEDKALRVSVRSQSSVNKYPLLVVVRQQKRVFSLQIPLEPPPNTYVVEEYDKVSHTLCPSDSRLHASNALDQTQRLFLDVTTSSEVSVNFSVIVNVIDDFFMSLNSTTTVVVSPGESSFYMFSFPDDVDMVLVKATSDDDLCAMVSVQNISCPVFDSEETIRYGNLYQTMTTKAGITVTKGDYPKGFFVVVVVLTSDDLCAPHFQHVTLHRRKTVSIIVEEKIKFLEYVAAILAGVAYCAFFYVVCLVLACVQFIRTKRRLTNSSPDGAEQPCSSSVASSNNPASVETDSDLIVSSGSSFSEEDYDALSDAENEKDVFSDLARARTRRVKRKSFLYILGLLTIAIFYAVPVVQLVVTYQKVLDETGNQDICYYNFWCSHPLGPVSDFNHVYSNIAYVFFGILFVALCVKRERRFKNDALRNKQCGIPQYMGLLYAMGGALIMEGLLSGCYHICPNHSNFQFDTAFMYVMAVLCMLKIYQSRHPDLSANANSTYFVLAVAVLVGVMGVLSNSVYFWAVFAIGHVGVCILLSIHLYYMGRWTFNWPTVTRIRRGLRARNSLRSWLALVRPAYADRMVLLVLGNAANCGLSIFGVTRLSIDFASFLLIIFLTNLLLYIAFYIIMKKRHGEVILLEPFVYLLLCSVSWAVAGYFYLHPQTTWAMTPAHSRQYNGDCAFLHFYDTHDVWHFLSASAMFFGFMLLLTLDDDLRHTPRNKIPVF